MGYTGFICPDCGGTGGQMSETLIPAQSPVDVNVRPAAWAIKQRDYDDDRDDPWAGIYCNPDTAREDADALEATSTDRFDAILFNSPGLFV